MKNLISALITLAMFALTQAASLEVSLASRFIVRGEQTVMEITLADVTPPESLRLPAIPGVVVQPRGFGGPNTTILPGRKIGYVYQYQISSFEVGAHTIPKITMRVGDETVESDPISFEVFDAKSLTFSELKIGDEIIPYAAFFKTTKTNPYVGEIVPVELKVYFPANIRIEEWGIPDFERSGITAWRFEPRPQIGNVILLGANYQCASYPSNMSASQAGNVRVGPAKIRLIALQNVLGQFGFERNALPLYLNAEALDLDAKPLPPNPPKGFTNAIGTFTIDASVSDTELREGDPINVELQVSGKGNLDSMDAPILSDPEQWKLYDATRNQMGEERRFQKGTVTFKQFMRPTSRQLLVPPFQLPYFDPDLGEYKVVSTPPIPLTVAPSTAVMQSPNNAAMIPAAADIPIEKMTDILGIISGSALTVPSSSIALPHLWHLIPLIVTLVLCFAIFYRKLLPRMRPTPCMIERKADWKLLEQASDDPAQFLRHAGRFIEKWSPSQQPSSEIQSILDERDQSCFLPTTNPPVMTSSRRKEILKTLRKLVMLAIFGLGLCCISPPSSAEEIAPTPTAEQLYEQGNYKEAITKWLSSGPYETLSAATLYNIGNTCYRSGSQGQAALYYRRALMVEPQHAEARQNLRFLERKFGALTIKRPDYQYKLTQIPETWLTNSLFACAWAAVISLLIFPATRSGSKLRIAAVAALVIGPLLSIACAVGRHYYPDDSQFAPYSDQAVIVTDKATIFADASRSAGQVIQAPGGSLCRVIQRSDRWIYVAFATQTRGWIPVEHIEPLVPTSPPTTPSFQPASQEEKGPSA